VSSGLNGTMDGGSTDHLDNARTESPPVTEGLTNDAVLATLAEQIHQLRDRLVDAENLWATQIASVDETNLTSAVNLAHYWAIRQCDLRELQLELAASGCHRWGDVNPTCRPHSRRSPPPSRRCWDKQATVASRSSGSERVRVCYVAVPCSCSGPSQPIDRPGSW
jgi:hypothetical protein